MFSKTNDVWFRVAVFGMGTVSVALTAAALFLP